MKKAIHAQRAGALAVVISNSRADGENYIFEMELPQTQGSYNTEPVTLPLVMISQKVALAISRFSGSGKYFSLQGIYDAGANDKTGYGSKRKKKLSEASPIDVHDDPVELLFDFSSGTLEMNLGQPGKVGNPRQRHRTINIERQITLQDIYTGGEIKVKVQRHRLCPQCHGRGGIEGGLKPCPHCAHTHAPGRHVVSDLLGTIFSQKNEKTCSICKGHGEVLKTPQAKCPTCNGHGTLKEEKMLTVKYPVGMNDGYVKVFAKAGSQSRYGDPGDVVVTLKTILPHGFERQGADLSTAIEISFSEALLGFNRTIVLPNGERVEIRTSGITRPGTTITKYGCGLPYEQEMKKARRGKKRVERLESNKESNAKASGAFSDQYGEKGGILRGNVHVHVKIDFNNLVGLRNYNKEHVRAAFGANTNHSKDWGSGANESYRNHTHEYFNFTKNAFGNILRNAFRV